MDKLRKEGGDPQESPLSLADILSGKGMPFEVDGRTFHIRQPTTEEYDDARLYEALVRKRLLAMPEIAELKKLPISDEYRAALEAYISWLEEQYESTDDQDRKETLASQIAAYRLMLDTYTLADEVAGQRAAVARDRYLTARLLCDADGNPMFDMNSPEDVKRWERLPMKIKDAARVAVHVMLEAVENAPFE